MCEVILMKLFRSKEIFPPLLTLIFSITALVWVSSDYLSYGLEDPALPQEGSNYQTNENNCTLSGFCYHDAALAELMPNFISRIIYPDIDLNPPGLATNVNLGWHRYGLTGVSWESIHMLSPTDGWAVGRAGNADDRYPTGGIIAHFDGSKWQQVNSPSDWSLTSLYMVSSTEGWAVGARGSIIRFDGHSWESVNSPTQETLTSVHMVSPSEGWAVGTSGTILHYTNGVWTEIDSPVTTTLTSISMISSTEGWAVGSGISYDSAPTILQYSDNIWEIHVPQFDGPLWGIDMVSSDEGWAFGSRGLVHYDGESWQIENQGIAPGMLQDIQMLSPGTGWAVGLYGKFHLTGGQWQQVSQDGANAISMMSADHGWVAGLGKFMQLSDGIWLDYSEPTSQSLWAIDMISSEEGWAVGGSGTILHYKDGFWSSASSPTNWTLLDISMVSANEGWAVGALGTILHYADGIWAQIVSPTTKHLTAISMVSQSEGWAVGQDGAILHYTNGAWSIVSSPTDLYLQDIKMVSREEGWAVGRNGLVLHYTGGNWQQIASPTLTNLLSIDMVSAEDGWIVGWQPGFEHALLKYSNGAWQPLPIDKSLDKVFMLSDSESWALSAGAWAGGINRSLRYINGSWETMSLPTGFGVSDIDMISSDEGWIVGNFGTILYFGSHRPFISHMEVSQAVQDSRNSVPLIENKLTFIRIYASCDYGCNYLPNITGVLRAYGPTGELPGSPLPPLNNSINVYHADWQSQRSNPQASLNFTLPVEWTTGTITLTAEIDSLKYSRLVTFQQANQPRIVYVPINYRGQIPDLSRIRTGQLFSNKILPTNRVTYVPGTTIEWNRCLENSFLCPLWRQNSFQLLNELTTSYRLVNAYVYGWLPEEAYGGGLSNPTWAGGAGIAAFGDDDPMEGQRIFAHEIAHLMGRRHTNTEECHPNIDPSSDWPYANSRIQAFGIDGYGFGWLVSSPSSIKDPMNTYDYMSYCGSLADGTVWTSPWTYERIFAETLQPESSEMQIQTGSAKDYLIASGLIYIDDSASLDPIWVITSTMAVNPPAGTDYCLEAQDHSNTSLESYCFDAVFVNYETGEPSDVHGYNIILPYPDDLARVVLRKGLSELVVRAVSPNAPVVNVITPNGGETWEASGTYIVTWTASDDDGDSLYYRVFYGPNEDEWMPISTTITETHLAVNAGELPGSDTARIRVLASDGVNTVLDESDSTFVVESKPPWATIPLCQYRVRHSKPTI
jgi:photosystem II stability/assembly factor-like uncharacterized protein